VGIPLSSRSARSRERIAALELSKKKRRVKKAQNFLKKAPQNKREKRKDNKKKE